MSILVEAKVGELEKRVASLEAQVAALIEQLKRAKFKSG
jgi:uncharacterized protein YceH (UPF0502 family)